MGWTRAMGAAALCTAFVCTSCVQGRGAMRRAPRDARGPRVTSDFTRSAALDSPRRASDCYVDVVFDRHPERPYVVLGRVSAVWLGSGRTALGATEAVVVPLLRREACRAGAHAVFSVETASEDHLREGPRGARLSRSVRGTAIAAVYVSPSGQVEPPPAGPGLVIRVPASLEQRAAPGNPPEEEGTEDPVPAWEPGIDDPWAVPAP